MSKIEIVKDKLKSIQEKSTSINKSDFAKAKNLVNNALESEWKSTFVNFYLDNVGWREDEFAQHKTDTAILSDLYYSTTALHTLENKFEKLNKQAQKLTHPKAKEAMALAIGTIKNFLPFVGLVGSIRQQMEINASEKLQRKADAKDPISAIPLASRASIVLIRGRLTTEVESHKDGLRNHFVGVLHHIVDLYMGRPESDRIQDLNKISNPKISSDHQLILYKCLERVGINSATLYSSGPKPPYTLRDGYRDYLSSLADQYTDQIVSQYISKHVQKLAAITERMPLIDKIQIHARLDRGSLASTISLSFADSSAFAVRSQTVVSFTENGLVSRYPTTFHDVIDANGRMVAKKLSEAEMIEWSEGKLHKSSDSAPSM